MFNYADVSIKKYGEEYKVSFTRRAVDEEGRVFLNSVNEKVGDRFLSSLSRSRSTVLELALCNEWEYFVTLTLNKEKYDRYNLDKYRKDLNQFIRDLRKKGYDIKYVFVPQKHKDGAWHIHGLISGIPSSMLSRFVLGKHPIDLVYSTYLNWGLYEEKFGYNSFGVIKSKSAVSRYILRYITRDWEGDNELYKNLFFASQGLNRSVTLFSGNVGDFPSGLDFENEYVGYKFFKSMDEVKIFLDKCNFI